MLEAPEFINVSPQITAVIRLNIPCEECQEQWGLAIAELFAVLEQQGIVPAGPVFDHHFRSPDTHFDFEIGVPTATPVKASGRVIPSERPAFRAAKVVLAGDYDQLPDAWPEFMEWIAAQGCQPAADLWQVFAKGPASDPDPTTYRTELIRPLQS